MNNSHCCHLTCTLPAVWSISYSDNPEDYSEYCGDHMMEYLPEIGGVVSRLNNFQMSNPNKQIINLLKNADFVETEDNSYSNPYCSVCLDYQNEGETVIVNNAGDIIIQLSTNYYAILGWLLKSRMGSIKLLDL